MRHHVFPLRAIAFGAARHFDDAEILRLVVGAHDPAAVRVFHLVFVVALARQEHLELELRGGGVGVPDLGRDRALRVDQQILLVLGARELRVEALVFLRPHDGIGGDVGVVRAVEPVTADAKSEQRLRILLDVEERLVVARPDDVVLHVGQRDRIDLARRELHDLHHVLAAADGVFRPGHELAVGADGDVADLEEIVALRKLVAVEQDFFGRRSSVPARRE